MAAGIQAGAPSARRETQFGILSREFTQSSLAIAQRLETMCSRLGINPHQGTLEKATPAQYQEGSHLASFTEHGMQMLRIGELLSILENHI